VEGFCNIQVDNPDGGPFTIQFNIRMDGETDGSRLDDPGVLEFDITP